MITIDKNSFKTVLKAGLKAGLSSLLIFILLIQFFAKSTEQDIHLFDYISGLFPTKQEIKDDNSFPIDDDEVDSQDENLDPENIDLDELDQFADDNLTPEELEKNVLEIAVDYNVSGASKLLAKYQNNDEVQEITKYPLKIIRVFATSDIGFIVFYFFIWLTLFLQFFYKFIGKAHFLQVDLNLQAPPMLGVGGTIYALVNSNITMESSIVQELTAILLGAGLTTLLGIAVFIINHYLSRYIKTYED